MQELTRRSATAGAAAECIIFLDGVACLLRRDGECFTPEELVGVLETACSRLGTALAREFGHANTYRRLRTATDGILAEVLLRDAGLSGELEE